MADEYYEEKTSAGRSGTVRPSMVLMTGKLLGVSEGIAAMNLRIACGVVLCLVFIVATFAVNLVAFDYAKTEKASGAGNLMKDKSSGQVVNFHTGSDHVTLTPEMDLNYGMIRKVREIDVQLVGDSFGHYMISSAEQLPCPAGHEDKCYKDNLYLMFPTAGDRVFYRTGSGPMNFADHVLEDSASVIAAADAEVVSRRHLLWHENKSHVRCDHNTFQFMFTMDMCHVACAGECY